jgi:ribulose-5-phosphate 4-epimerase/fuculose-1-phosphate aldolase
MIMQRKEKLAYAYWILGKLGLDDHTYTHLSVRTENQPEQYHIYPFGLRFSEVTPEILLKVDLDGTIIEGQEHQYNQTGYTIHGSIYRARPDIHAIFHLHTIATTAVSSIQAGLMPLTQWALHFYHQVAYHAYNSLALAPNQGQDMIEDLGDKNILFLRNHGFIACGRTVEEAMFYCHHLELACKAQIAILSMHQPIANIAPTICEQSHQDLLGFEKSLGERDWQAWVRWVDATTADDKSSRSHSHQR